MNEAILEAYRNLTQALLTSPHGEELQILAAHQDLMGIDLVQTMLQVADNLLENGDPDNAERLRKVAQAMGVYEGMSGHGKTLGVAGSQSPTQPHQTSPPAKGLLIDATQKNTASTPSNSQQ